MTYQITRGGQSYGPYTLADLERYVASGHILPTDLAKSDEMSEWAPVSQILNPSGLPPAYPVPPSVPPAAPYSGGYVQPASVQPGSFFPDSPNLHWGLVLLFDCLTCGLFQVVWNFILSAWMKRVQPNSQAILYYAGGYGLLMLSTGLSFPVYIAMMNHTSYTPHFGSSLIGIAAWALRLVARFNMKSSLEEHYNTVEPIGFRMSGVLLFFLGGLYIQSQLNRINEIKQAIRHRDFGR